MDTVASNIDKLMTVNLKTLFNLRSTDVDKMKNLSIQRQKLQSEISDLLITIFTQNIDDNDISRPQHKTY